jgi:hypothetical protein
MSFTVDVNLSDIQSSTDQSQNRVLPWESIPVYENNPPTEWSFYPLYSDGQGGTLLMWQIGFDGTNLYTLSGQEITATGKIGKLTLSEPTEIKTNTSGRTVIEQALLQARQRRNLKYRNGYREKNDATAVRFPAQEAVKLTVPNGDSGSGYTKLTDSHFKEGVACQPKLDGIRMIFWPNRENQYGVDMVSRGKREYSFFSELKKEIVDLMGYLPPNTGVDGEMWKLGWSFSLITSIVRTEKREHPLANQLDFYIFDIVIPEMTTEERIKTLYMAYRAYLEDGNVNKRFHILQHVIAHNYDQILSIHKIYSQSGFEDTMIRKMAGNNTTSKHLKQTYYRGKRNNNLIKHKDFKEDEGTIIDVEEGTGADKGKAIFILQTKNGKRFNCRPAATHEERKAWLNQKDSLIGKLYTYKFQELTDDEIPRFPSGKAFRDYE